MNRARRGSHQAQQKPFVIGGVYENNSCPHFTPTKQPNSNANTPSKPPQTQRQQALQQQQQQQVDEIKQIEQTHVQEQREPMVKKMIMKEPVAAKVENNSENNSEDADMDAQMNEANGDRKVFFKKIFATRKKSSIRAKEKKIRQNRHLRKVILPKNALMALNEVKGIQIGDFVINSNATGGFSAIVTVNNIQYEGKGISKAVAKNSACEKALRDFVIAKMRQKPRRSSQTTSEPMDTSETNEGNESDGGTAQTDDTDVPMINLASFALYKLFSEWENEGFEIPEFHASSHHNPIPSERGENNHQEKTPKKPPMRTELPVNWEHMHPATLLCMMRPGLTYSNWNVEGERPNAIQSITVVIDGEEFYGAGRSKKIARKNVAISACNKLFDTNFCADEE